jgi:hypothetical protein
VDKAVKSGIVQPGQYLILQFDFSCVVRPRNIDESTEFLRDKIHIGLSRFKSHYAKYLGESFVSDMSTFKENNPAGNLRHLIEAVDLALQDIHDQDKKDHALWGIRGVYLFQTTTHYYVF